MRKSPCDKCPKHINRYCSIFAKMASPLQDACEYGLRPIRNQYLARWMATKGVEMKKKMRRKMRNMDGGLAKRIAELWVEEMQKFINERSQYNDGQHGAVFSGSDVPAK